MNDALRSQAADERERLIFRLLLLNKWFIIPTAVAYEWIVSISPFRASVYHFITPTIAYTTASLVVILLLWMSHRRALSGSGRFNPTKTLNICSAASDVVFVFFLIFVPGAGNYLWFLFLQPMVFLLLAPQPRRLNYMLVDGVSGLVVAAAIYGLLSGYGSPTGPPRFVPADLFLCLAGLFFVWISARVVHTWIEAINRQAEEGARLHEFWTEVQRRFPAEFFIMDDKGSLILASEAARQVIELPPDDSDEWPDESHAVRNALLLRFHAESPIDEVVTLPDDEREKAVQILPSFFGVQDRKVCIALIHEQDPQQPAPSTGLLRSDRLAVAGQIAAGLAHELGNPLGVIRSCASYIRQKAADDDPNREELELIETEADRCQNLIDRLLSLASPKRDAPAHHDLRDIVNNSIQLVKYQAGSREIEVNLPSRPAPIFANEGQLTAVLVNLYLNALQSMEQSPPEARLWVRLRTRGAEAIIDVTDEGCGISREELERIFDPFFTKKASGTGLGLSIVHQIIYSMNGRIDVASDEGKGATFSVYLPIEESEDL